MPSPHTSKLFLTVLASVGWFVALMLALFPTPSPPAPASVEATPAGAPASQSLHDQQLRTVLDDIRDGLVRRRPEEAMECVSYAFSLCRARDQQPPAEVYQLFAEALCQTLAAKESAPSAERTTTGKRSTAAVAVSPKTAAPVATPSRAEAPAPLLDPAPSPEASRPAAKPDFSLPQPDYPTAPRVVHRDSGSPESTRGPADLPPPPPRPGLDYHRSEPPPVPQGMPAPPFPGPQPGWGPPAGGPPEPPEGGPPPEGRRRKRPDGPPGQTAELPYPPYSPNGGSPPGY